MHAKPFCKIWKKTFGLQAYLPNSNNHTHISATVFCATKQLSMQL